MGHRELTAISAALVDDTRGSCTAWTDTASAAQTTGMTFLGRNVRQSTSTQSL